MFNFGDVLSERDYKFVIRELNNNSKTELYNLRNENALLRANEKNMLDDIECFKKEVEKLNNKILKLKGEIK